MKIDNNKIAELLSDAMEILHEQGQRCHADTYRGNDADINELKKAKSLISKAEKLLKNLTR